MRCLRRKRTKGSLRVHDGTTVRRLHHLRSRSSFHSQSLCQCFSFFHIFLARTASFLARRVMVTTTCWWIVERRRRVTSTLWPTGSNCKGRLGCKSDSCRRRVQSLTRFHRRGALSLIRGKVWSRIDHWRRDRKTWRISRHRTGSRSTEAAHNTSA